TCGTRRESAPPVPHVVQAPQPEGKAMASLVLGILGLFFSVFASIPAIILGHKSYSEIRNSSGRLAGESLALVGLILGYIGTALLPIILVIALPTLMRSRPETNESTAAATVRTLNMVEGTYSTTYPKAGYADLATLGPGTLTCSGDETQKNACLID